MRRTFRPDYVSFAGTYQCNLACPHCCVPIEWTDRLPIETAIRFLEDAHSQGIKRIGFTGGEPFVYPEFVIAVARRAAELGFRFDKVMSNGVWYQDEAHLIQVLSELRDAGFTGKLGMTVDKFHGIDIDKLALFCLTARRVFNRDTILSLSYASRAPDQGLELIRRLADSLGGVLEYSELLHRHIVVTPDLTMTLNWNHLAPVERAEKFAGGWEGEWFKEDYCEGPGQALIVTPKGEVKPCCGFASDLDQLTIGNIHTDSGESLAEDLAYIRMGAGLLDDLLDTVGMDVANRQLIEIRSEATTGFDFAFGGDDEGLTGAFTVIFFEPLTLPAASELLGTFDGSEVVPVQGHRQIGGDDNVAVKQFRVFEHAAK